MDTFFLKVPLIRGGGGFTILSAGGRLTRSGLDPKKGRAEN